MGTIPRPALDRFMEKVAVQDDGCWYWRGHLTRDGYGGFRIGMKGSRSERAHRAAWKLLRGAIPDGLWVLHRCDVRVCVNPDHLFLGTAKDNTGDMLTKGRNRPTRGERNAQAKLTDDVIREIRRLANDAGLPQSQIARQFGIGQSEVSRIKTGQRWAHVTSPT